MTLTALRVSLFVALVAVSGMVCAQAPDADVNLDLRFGIQRESGTLHFEDGSSGEIRHTRIQATLYQTGLRWFQPGLYVATGWSSLHGDPRTDGLNPAGESLGLRLRSELPVGAGLALVAQGGYTYHGLKDEAAGNRVELQWYQLDLRAGLAWTTESVVLSGGGYYLDVDGEEQLSGDLRRDRDFGVNDQFGAWAGLDVRLDRTGTVGIHAQTEPREAVTFRAARRF